MVKTGITSTSPDRYGKSTAQVDLADLHHCGGHACQLE
jgi:hypothetical protein